MTQKPKVLYDTQIFDIQNYGGISRYFANLIEGVEKDGTFETRLPIIHSTNYYIHSFPRILNHHIGNLVCKKNLKKTRWNNWYVNRYIRINDFDLYHPTYYDTTFLDNLKKPLVITVHDMIYENFPQFFPDARKVIREKKTMIETAQLIISISEFTRSQLLKHYPNTAHKIRVVYHGLPEEKKAAANVPLPGSYLLYIGDRNAPYKNFIPFVSAIAPLLQRDLSLSLICAGGGSLKSDENWQLDKLKIRDQVWQINASDNLIVQLYQQALLFAYPSIEEGFGLPMLEAFRHRCPIACSNTSCLPEVGGNAVSYFDPFNPQSIQEAIGRLISTPDLRETQKISGQQQLRKFSFENSLRQTIDCYQELTL